MAKTKIKHVRFSKEEMAYEPPVEVDFSSGLTLRSVDSWKQYLSAKRQYAHLDSDVRKAFPNDRRVNMALRSIIKKKAGGAARRVKVKA